jgi:hypothetical protein
MSDEDRKGLEHKLFSWIGWDEVDTATLQFYKVVLKVQIGKFPIGSTFECAIVSFDHSYVELYQDDCSWMYEVELKVGELISNSIM